LKSIKFLYLALHDSYYFSDSINSNELMPTFPEIPRFFIALMPPPGVMDYANQVIQELGDRFQVCTAKAPPHVTLQPPFQWPLAEVETIETCLRQFAATQAEVPISLSGFGAFAPRVLYINVLKTPELMALQKALAEEMQRTLQVVDPKAKSRAFAPHMTVASRKMTPRIFKQAWAELQPRSVEFEFVCDRLTLLIHDGHQWHIRCEFPLA
jgi:2'-5' RNA ligase